MYACMYVCHISASLKQKLSSPPPTTNYPQGNMNSTNCRLSTHEQHRKSQTAAPKCAAASQIAAPKSAAARSPDRCLQNASPDRCSKISGRKVATSSPGRKVATSSPGRNILTRQILAKCLARSLLQNPRPQGRNILARSQHSDSVHAAAEQRAGSAFGTWVVAVQSLSAQVSLASQHSDSVHAAAKQRAGSAFSTWVAAVQSLPAQVSRASQHSDSVHATAEQGAGEATHDLKENG